MSEHHWISASGWHTWSTCTGQPRFVKDIPSKDTAYSLEGTEAHEFAEAFLAGKVTPKVSDEMAVETMKYIEHVHALAQGHKIFPEFKVSLDHIIKDGFGTSDAVIIVDDLLIIVDLKYGMGVKVSAHKNGQLMIYASGVYRALKPSVREKIKHISINISQPRLDHYDGYDFSVEELEAFEKEVSAIAELCMTDTAPLNPSEKACQFCRGNATCPALYEHNLKVVGEDFQPLAPEAMTDDQLRLVIDNKALIEKWLKSVESHIFSRIEDGGTFEGYKMVAGRSIRKWNEQAEEVLVKILGDKAFEKKLINITTAEKTLGKKQFNELGITFKPEGKPTLAPITDKRKSLSIMDDFEIEK